MVKLIIVGANWCPSCKALDNHISDYQENTQNPINIEKYDMDDESKREFIVYHSIRSLPTMIAVDSKGTVLSKKIGLMSKEGVNAWIKGLTS